MTRMEHLCLIAVTAAAAILSVKVIVWAVDVVRAALLILLLILSLSATACAAHRPRCETRPLTWHNDAGDQWVTQIEVCYG